MITFEQWNAPVSADLAHLLIEELQRALVEEIAPARTATTRIINHVPDGNAATRQLSTGETPTRQLPPGSTVSKVLNDPQQASRIATKYVSSGQKHLGIAKNHVERGMLSIGKIIQLVRAGTQREVTNSQVAKALDAIKMGLDVKQQTEKDHPLQRLLHIANEIDDLIGVLTTTQRQSSSFSGNQA